MAKINRVQLVEVVLTEQDAKAVHNLLGGLCEAEVEAALEKACRNSDEIDLYTDILDDLYDVFAMAVGEGS